MKTNVESAPARIRRMLMSQPALVAEVELTQKREGKPAAVHLLALRLGEDVGPTCAGLVRYYDSSSRVVGSSYISRNGGKRREYSSLVGNIGISMCAEYPMTKRVYEWIEAQDQEISDTRPYAAVVAGLV